MKQPYQPAIFLFLCLALFLTSGTQKCSQKNIEQITGPGFTPDYEFHTGSSLDSDDWEFTGLSCSVENNTLHLCEKSKIFAYPVDAPFSSTTIVRAHIKVTEPVKDSWKIAGIGVYIDDDYYWQLALVEQPDNMGRGHYAELAEMYAGTWLAHYEGETYLTQQAHDHLFHWKYNRTYELILILTPAGITGYVLELNGITRVHISYKFDGKAVTYGRPALVSDGFYSIYSGFEVKAADPVLHMETSPEIPPFTSTGYNGIRGRKTGFFHTETMEGIHWVIDPEGIAFIIIGTDHVNYNGMWCEALGYSPYKKNISEKYDSEEAWAESTVSRLVSWGFNSLGSNSSPSVRYRGLPYPVNLNIGTMFADTHYITQKTTWTGFPNVFHPDFPRYCELTAKKHCAPVKDDPWLTGYFIDNELEWHAWTGKGLFADTFSKQKDDPAKIALIGLIKNNYSDTRDFNKDWNININNFDSLFSTTDAPEPLTTHAREIIQDYIRFAAEKYFSITCSNIRKYDPNHMIFGCRFAGQAPDIWDIAGKYCDIISVNCYRTLDLETGKLTDGFEKELAAWYEQAGKPFMITEWSYPALDAGLPSRHGAGQRVPTQKDRAFAFTAFQKYLFSIPFVVGSDYFMWVDQPARGISSIFPEDSNYGLVKETDEPHILLTQAATLLHSHVYDIHLGNTTDFFLTPGEDRFIIENRGKRTGSGTVLISRGGKEKSESLEISPGEKKSLQIPGSAGEPGWNFITCRVVPEQPLLETDPENNRIFLQSYIPGTIWHSPESGYRIPVLVANKGQQNLENIPLALEGRRLHQPDPAGSSPSKAWKVFTGDGTVVECQYDRIDSGDSGTLSFMIKQIKRYDNKDFYLYPITPGERNELSLIRQKAIRLDNGVIRAVKKSSSTGTIFDEISLDRTPIGRLIPLVWQYTQSNNWVETDRTESIILIKGDVKTTVDLILSKTRPPGKKYRICYRLTLFQGLPWFSSRVLWIENIDSSAWLCKGYYHYTPSFIGGSPEGDEDVLDHWVDRKAGYCFGVVWSGAGIKVRFWKDAQGNQHPDAYRELDLYLEPGEHHDLDDPAVCILCCREKSWYDLKKKVEAVSGLVTVMSDTEYR